MNVRKKVVIPVIAGLLVGGGAAFAAVNSGDEGNKVATPTVTAPTPTVSVPTPVVSLPTLEPSVAPTLAPEPTPTVVVEPTVEPEPTVTAEPTKAPTKAPTKTTKPKPKPVKTTAKPKPKPAKTTKAPAPEPVKTKGPCVDGIPMDYASLCTVIIGKHWGTLAGETKQLNDWRASQGWDGTGLSDTCSFKGTVKSTEGAAGIIGSTAHRNLVSGKYAKLVNAREEVVVDGTAYGVPVEWHYYIVDIHACLKAE